MDHSVPVLRIADLAGNVQGVIFNYACHCTTLRGDHNRINADWAGYATSHLEAAYPESVALCLIGCGADANPDPLGSLELSQLHGRELGREVKKLVEGMMIPIDQPILAAFDYAGLPFDLPTREDLEGRSHDQSIQVRRHAEHFLSVLEKEGRLPATYPVPIQTWRFGNQLTLVFLGGEVVADYALRLQREMPAERLWITAYANDVLGYIASERMRAEGGYEYDLSCVYYTLPGPWAAGTEELLIRRVHDLLERDSPQAPLEPKEALASISVPADYVVQLVAVEPLVVDPINIAFGLHGELWVVEMGDYPEVGETASSTGRIKRLTDNDGDGDFDHAQVFLEGLSFPTGVHPWRDGVIVSAAPEVFFARDSDGDGIADKRETLVSGFRLANPQHRINGFSYGLDHSLHCAAGDNLGELTSLRSSQVINASGRDVQIWPETGQLAATSGRTQFIRSRNDWGDWFGNENSRPMYHYPIEDRYLRRNPVVRIADNKQQLFDPLVAPLVYPLSRTSDRFNDLSTANRFTSACSAIIMRSKSLGTTLAGNAFVCEPVHNLVHHAELREQGASFRVSRDAAEQDTEFLRSIDPWFRPVRVTVGPDGKLWVVDMYRAVIEHPEWIPQAWQQQLDLRAGSDRGRIYRVALREDAAPRRLPTVATLPADQLVTLLTSDSGTLRDMAQQELIHRGDSSIAAPLRTMSRSDSSPQARVHALWTLETLRQLDASTLLTALKDDHPGVVRNAILLAEPLINSKEAILESVVGLADNSDARVKLQLALTLGECPQPAAGIALGKLVSSAADDRWLSLAIVSSSKHHSLHVLEKFLIELRKLEGDTKVATQLLVPTMDLIATATAAGLDPSALLARAVAVGDPKAPWVFSLAAACVDAAGGADQPDESARPTILALYERAKLLVSDETAPSALRCEALHLFGCSLGDAQLEVVMLCDLLSPTTHLDVQLAAVERLGLFRGRESADQLLAEWSNLSYSVRDAVALRMLTHSVWTEVLVDHLDAGTVFMSDLSTSARQILRERGPASLQERIDQLIGETPAPNQELLSRYLRFQRESTATVDLTRGQSHFQKLCALCHLPDSAGRATGPNLSNLTDRSREALTTSILDPNRTVEPKYHGHMVVTTDGLALSGIIVEEAGGTITLAQVDGKMVTIHRSEIEELRNTGKSVMPEGFQQELDPAMLLDLVEYLQSDSFSRGALVPQRP